MNIPKPEIAPETEIVEEDDEQSLPQPDETEAAKLSFDEEAGSLAVGRAAIVHYAKLAPPRPGVYRMIDARGDVLYVGKAKNVKKRIAAYTRPAGLDTRIERMIAATRRLEFVVTRTETEALLLEANLIKRLRPRFNVVLRDDKSFPYIMITSDHWAPQILKHRGARTRPGRYYGPFASVWAVNRTVNALQRAFLLRSCSDAFFESRTRPCLLYQIKRCSAPCTKEIDFRDYSALVREANAFLSGRSKTVKDALAAEMDKASAALDFERAAVTRDRLAAYPIPGNEWSVGRVIDSLYRLGVEVIHSGVDAVHVSGHARQGELAMLMSVTRPEFFIPVHGEYRHMSNHVRLAASMGIGSDRVLLCEDGDAVRLSAAGMERDGSVPGGYLFVDGSSVGDIGHGVLRDRMVLAEEGVVMAVATVDLRRSEVVGAPQIVTRGWAYDSDTKELLDEARDEVTKALEQALTAGSTDHEHLNRVARKALGRLVGDRTRQRPMIVPVIVTV